MIVELVSLVRWEWFKLRYRWMPWVLLAVLVLVTQLFIWGAFFAFRDTQEARDIVFGSTALDGTAVDFDCNDVLAGDIPEGAQVPSPDEEMGRRMLEDCQEWKAVQQEELGDLYSLITPPGSAGFAVGAGQTIGLILVAILTASVIGTEHGWGTVRPVLVRGVRRWYMLASRLAMVAIAFAGALVVIGVLGLVSGLAAGALASGTEGLESIYSWGDGLEVYAKAWFSVLPYGALVALVAVVTRSSAAGLGVGLGYYFLEQTAVAILLALFDWFQGVADYLLVYNISAFMGGGAGDEGGNGSITFGVVGGDPPGELHTALVMAAYLLVLGGLAFYLFQRRDIPGASRS